MGYTTDFEGFVSIEPPLNASEFLYLNKFASVRHMKRSKGPYFVDGHNYGYSDVENANDSSEFPGLWCQWVPTDDGTALEWDQGEKFYESEAWMSYIIDTFLGEGATAQQDILRYERIGAPRPQNLDQFDLFTFDHVLNGRIEAQGEDPEDRWQLIVKNNLVTSRRARLVWEDEV